MLDILALRTVCSMEMYHFQENKTLSFQMGVLQVTLLACIVLNESSDSYENL
jgi:hypothetical protein